LRGQEAGERMRLRQTLLLIPSSPFRLKSSDFWHLVHREIDLESMKICYLVLNLIFSTLSLKLRDRPEFKLTRRDGDGETLVSRSLLGAGSAY